MEIIQKKVIFKVVSTTDKLALCLVPFMEHMKKNVPLEKFNKKGDIYAASHILSKEEAKYFWYYKTQSGKAWIEVGVKPKYVDLFKKEFDEFRLTNKL